MSEPRVAAKRVLPLVLIVSTMLAYLPSFGAGFLAYDDPWLIQQNPMFGPDAWDTPLRAVFDLSKGTRLALGAEYLPVRDLLVWGETRVFGVAAMPMHWVSVSLYIAALLLLRSSLRSICGGGVLVEFAILLFALHPIHAESVAWLSGQKDVLAMLFVAAALHEHARGDRRSRWTVPFFVFAACGAKSMSIAVLGLLAAEDFLLRRSPDRVTYAASALVGGSMLALQLHTGKVVGMLSAPAGGSIQTAMMTMGPVILRYLQHCVLPINLSITYEVETATRWSLSSAGGYAFVLLSLSLSLAAALRRHERFWLFVWAWFFVPLLPVSQLGASLQNRMADRYAFLSVLAPCLLASVALHGAWTRTIHRSVRRTVHVLGVGALVALGCLTFHRSILFSDAVLLFSDATWKDLSSPKPAYHLGRALAAAGRSPEAELAFREALTRTTHGIVREHRRSANALAKLLAARGAVDEAQQVLEHVRSWFPKDSTVLANLNKLRAAADSGRVLDPTDLSPDDAR